MLFNRLIGYTSRINFVDETYGMRYHGRILNLYQFRGDISISQSTFNGNSLSYYDDGCEHTEVFKDYFMIKEEDPYPIYGNFDMKTFL